MLWFNDINDYKQHKDQCRVTPEVTSYFQECLNRLANRQHIQPPTVRSVHKVGTNVYLVRFYVDTTKSELTGCSLFVDVGKYSIRYLDVPEATIDHLNHILNDA